MSTVLSEDIRNNVVTLIADMRWAMESVEDGRSYSKMYLSINALPDRDLVEILGKLIEPFREEDLYATRLYRNAIIEIAEVQGYIDSRVSELNAAKAKKVTIDISMLPTELQAKFSK